MEWWGPALEKMVRHRKNKTILLTGGTGFLGSFVLKALLRESFDVIVAKKTGSDMFRIQHMLPNRHIVLAGCTRRDVEDIFAKYQPYCIMHIATCYGRNGESEDEITEANFAFPSRLLQVGKNNGLKGFINTDTFFTEDLGLADGEELHVKTKKAFLRSIQEGMSEIKIVNLKLEQMYGPADNPSKFIPSMIKRLQLNEAIYLTPGEQRRDFVYVEDVSRAFILALQHLDELKMFEDFGIGTGKNHSIKEAMEIMQTELQSDSVLHWRALPYRANEIMSSFADTSHNKKIGWQARVDLLTGLKKTIAYYKQYIL